MRALKNIGNGILKENPVFILIIGITPALAITTSLINAVGMGAATTFVLILSNFTVSVLRKIIPEKSKSVIYILIIATYVTVADLLLKTFYPELDEALGIYIPLIVINSIILGRVDIFAQKNKIIPSLLDAIGMGIGFSLALMIMGSIREILGSGSILDHAIVSDDTRTILFFILPPGAFVVYGFMIALFNHLLKKNN
jgi:electron transport complex protein RnfE